MHFEHFLYLSTVESNVGLNNFHNGNEYAEVTQRLIPTDIPILLAIPMGHQNYY